MKEIKIEDNLITLSINYLDKQNFIITALNSLRLSTLREISLKIEEIEKDDDLHLAMPIIFKVTNKNDIIKFYKYMHGISFTKARATISINEDTIIQISISIGNENDLNLTINESTFNLLLKNIVTLPFEDDEVAYGVFYYIHEDNNSSSLFFSKFCDIETLILKLEKINKSILEKQNNFKMRCKISNIDSTYIFDFIISKNNNNVDH